MGFNDELEIKTADDLAKEIAGTESDAAAEKLEEQLSDSAQSVSDSAETAEQSSADAEESAENSEGEITEEELMDKLRESELDEIKEVADAVQTEEMKEETPQKKKRFIMVPVIIAACILVGALLGYFIYNAFFLHEPEGTWVYTYVAEGADESEAVDFYYTFEKDGTCLMRVGTISYIGSYTKSKGDEGNSLLINQYYGVFAGEYTYTVSGSKLLGNQELTLYYGDTEYTMNQAKVKNDLITVSDDFVADENLVGEWEYVFPDYNVSYKFTFNADGTMQINQYDFYIYDCVYTTDGSTISCTFFTTEEVTEEIEYTCDGNTLTMLGMPFSRVGAATSDEA